MSAVVHEAFSTLVGMKLAEIEYGLIRGHCNLFNGRDLWWIGTIAELPDAIKQHPQADSIGYYHGDLAALRLQFSASNIKQTN